MCVRERERARVYVFFVYMSVVCVCVVHVCVCEFVCACVSGVCVCASEFVYAHVCACVHGYVRVFPEVTPHRVDVQVRGRWWSWGGDLRRVRGRGER